MLSKCVAYFATIGIVVGLLINPGGAWRRRRRRCTPTNCQMSSWSSWSPCSAVVCGNAGSRQRTRNVISSPSCGGAACPANRLETTLCYGSTAANCVMSSWSSWSLCSAVVCGNSGSRQRTRNVISSPSCGGAACPSNRLETTLCYGTTAADCVYSTWSTWSACPPFQCGDTQTSRRHIVSREQCGGTPCNMTALRKTRPCKQTFCVNQGTLLDGRCFCKTDYYGGCCQYKSKYACMHAHF